jgi:hypothetical protein
VGQEQKGMKKKVDKLSDQETTFWAQEQMRQLCGMGPSLQYLGMFGWSKDKKKQAKRRKVMRKSI